MLKSGAAPEDWQEQYGFTRSISAVRVTAVVKGILTKNDLSNDLAITDPWVRLLGPDITLLTDNDQIERLVDRMYRSAGCDQTTDEAAILNLLPHLIDVLKENDRIKPLERLAAFQQVPLSAVLFGLVTVVIRRGLAQRLMEKSFPSERPWEIQFRHLQLNKQMV